MKKILVVLAIAFGLSSCGVNHAYVFNHNQSNTQVELSQANFTVTKEVSGSAEVSYVLLFGAAKRSALYQEAYQNMLQEAKLVGGSKALTNVLTEEHVGGVPPFYYKRTITVRANVVEFK